MSKINWLSGNSIKKTFIQQKENLGNVRKMYGIIRDTRTLLNQNTAFPIFWEIPKFAEYILTKKFICGSCTYLSKLIETRYSFSGSEYIGLAGSFTLPLKWKPRMKKKHINKYNCSQTHLSYK